MSIREFFVRLMGGPANVKLDLARAYMDMGDKKQARELLQQVMAEGTVAERRKAEALLERIS